MFFQYYFVVDFAVIVRKNAMKMSSFFQLNGDNKSKINPRTLFSKKRQTNREKIIKIYKKIV